MDYKKAYDRLILRALARTKTKKQYYEKHHIIPRCLGGNDHKDNLVFLTAREHYIAHQFLVKIYPNNHRLLFAAVRMTSGSANQKRSQNRLYEWLRKKQSSYMKTRINENNNSFGTKWIYNNDLEVSKKIDSKLVDKYLNDGWKLGRKMVWNKRFCQVCEKEILSGVKHKKFCSRTCRNLTRDSIFKGREDELLTAYKKYNSINKAVKALGLPGAMGSWFIQAKEIIRSGSRGELLPP